MKSAVKGQSQPDGGTNRMEVGGMSQMQVLVCTDSWLLASQTVTDGWVVVGEAGGREQEPNKQKQCLDAKVELEICPLPNPQFLLVLITSRLHVCTPRGFSMKFITRENSFQLLKGLCFSQRNIPGGWNLSSLVLLSRTGSVSWAGSGFVQTSFRRVSPAGRGWVPLCSSPRLLWGAVHSAIARIKKLYTRDCGSHTKALDAVLSSPTLYCVQNLFLTILLQMAYPANFSRLGKCLVTSLAPSLQLQLCINFLKNVFPFSPPIFLSLLP